MNRIPSLVCPSEDERADDEVSQEESFTELRNLIVGPLDAEVHDVKTRLDDPRIRAKEISRVLPDAIVRRAAVDDELVAALTPTVEKAVRFSVKRNLRVFADALFPVIGPAVRKAIAEALRAMMQSLNESLENAFSWQGMKWRWEAFRTRKPFSEIVLLHSIVYRVEQVFLIHKQTGLMLQHVVRIETDVQDADMVSSMLTAIRDFVADSFRVQDHDSLETIRVGDLTVWIEQGPSAILAAVIRGIAPESFRAVLQRTIEKIHAQYDDALASFDGDTIIFESARPLLEDCLIAQYKEQPKKLSPVLVAATVGLIAALSLWVFFTVRDSLRWENFLSLLHAQEGIVVTAVERQDGKHVIRGLRDEFAKEPSELLGQAQIKPNTVVFQWTPYQSLTKGMILKRAHQILRPPPTVTLRSEDGELVAEGSAPHDWIEEARRIAPAMPGVKAFRSDGLREDDQEQRQAFENYLNMLRHEKGIMITSAEKRGDKYHVAGLLDPLAKDPLQILKLTPLSDAMVTFHWEPYQSLDPYFIAERAKRLLRPPSTISIASEDGCVLIRGQASHQWIVEFQRWIRTIPGTPCVRDQELVDLDEAEFHTITNAVQETNILFSENSAKPLPNQEETMHQVAANLVRMKALSNDLGLPLHVQVVGHADQRGSEEKNLKLSRQRAEHVVEFLVSQGFPRAQLAIEAVGSKQPIGDESEDQAREKNRRVSFRVLSDKPKASEQSVD